MRPDDVREDWAERSGEFSPEYYAHLGPNDVSETLADAFSHYLDDDASILELGCGSGRHLAQLRDRGFEDLHGIDINAESFDVMAEHFPGLHDTGTFHAGALEDVLPEFKDGAFDAVYSVETLQHVHPEDGWVFEEVVRVTDDLLATAENEGNNPTAGDQDVSYVNDDFPLYHRDWKRVFGDLGAAELLCEPTSRDTIRVFRVL
ncbi:class I SAM-dependent methyltransferase [Salarchaeum sp. JOR-1]|uniref:class I SAM-dependent methyltransferase n=1 Tax=Salarchaeum sp. JOR-1 TaxID=2599399 RepID=UPI0011984F81|nr:class I SAM-dependent methyltransferase [Salarchaeum sp. JOR-1]QDX41305.1 class I SAM-dependent methyltransferase [Salarchaeum sp. JOR-1]